MAVFDPKSRYAKPPLTPYAVTDLRGRVVNALPMPGDPGEVALGDIVRKQGQRLDHLAASLLRDPHGYWRFIELNGGLLPDALAERERLAVPAPIPMKKRRG